MYFAPFQFCEAEEEVFDLFDRGLKVLPVFWDGEFQRDSGEFLFQDEAKRLGSVFGLCDDDLPELTWDLDLHGGRSRHLL